MFIVSCRWIAVVSLCLFWATPWAIADEVGLFALTSNRLYEDRIDPAQHPRLADLGLRELVRQGLLISARDEFGLATRDETLRETVDRDSPATFDVVITPKQYHGIDFVVSRDGEELLKLYIRDMFDNPLAYQKIAQAVEKQSRGEYADMLDKAGFARRPHEWNDSAELPEGVESLLLEMNDISQYRALRAIHQAIRESGESPERLAGLVRGYANLGQLTIRGIDCRGFAFRCRAWLYAVRLGEKAPESSLSKWCLAYAQVMAGQPSAARSNLEGVAESKEAWPDWAKLLDHYCHYRYEEMAALAFQGNDPHAELATVLWVRAVQQLNSPIALLEASKQAIEHLPHCLWLQDQMYQAAGIGYQRMLSGMGPQLLSAHLIEQLPYVEGLPPAVAERLADAEPLDQSEIASLATDIVAAGTDDRQEPSLEVLGRNAEAFNMLHIFRIAWLWKGPLGSEASDYVDEMVPVVKAHPLSPLLKTFRTTKSALPETLEPHVKDFAFKEGNPLFGYELYATLPANLKLQNTSAADARDVCWFAHMKDEEFIVAEVFRSRQLQDAMLRELKVVAKESPLRVSYEVELHFDGVKDKLDEWQEKYGHYPSFHRALGRVYIKQGKYKEAAEHLTIAARQIADSDVLQSLAEAYYKQDDDRWRATLELILAREDYGLDHARANALIAGTLMSEGEYDEALPYAQQSARSGASWAFRVLIECLTAQGKWAEAESLAQADTMRYRTPLWFYWCAATGQGDLDAAWEAEEQRMRRFDQLAHINIPFYKIWYLMASGQDAEALAHVTTLADEGYRPSHGTYQALLADAVGDTEFRDRALEKLAAWKPATPEEWSSYPHMAPILQKALAENRAIALDDMAGVLKGRNDQLRWLSGMYFVAGEYNRLHAEGEEQTLLLEELAREPQLDTWPRVLAWVRLRQMGREPHKLEGRHFMMQLHKAGSDPQTK